MLLRALRSFPYDKRQLKPGDVFDVKKSSHVLVLTTAVAGKTALAEKVEDEKAEAQPSPGGYQTRHQEAAPDLEKLTKPKLIELAGAAGVEVDAKMTKATILSKLRYARRDMRAAR
jgi:hypothetical protein